MFENVYRIICVVFNIQRFQLFLIALREGVSAEEAARKKILCPFSFRLTGTDHLFASNR